MHIMIKFPDLQVWEYNLTTFLTTKYEQDKRVFLEVVLNLKTERILLVTNSQSVSRLGQLFKLSLT